MNLKAMSKEQKQYLLLGIIGGVLIVVLIAFGINAILSSTNDARTELDELRGKIEAAERTVETNRRNRDEFLDSIEALRKYLAGIPPDRNYYSWATEVIYREARHAGVEVDAMEELNIAATDDGAEEGGAVEMESYALRINARGSYEGAKRLLKRFSDHHPLVRVTGLEISAGSKNEIHEIQLFIEWPFNMGRIAEGWKHADQSPEPMPGENGSQEDV